MSKATSTRQLLVVTTVGGILFGAIMAGWVAVQAGGLPLWSVVLTGLVAAIFFGGCMFGLLYFGFARPRQLDPGPSGFADRRVSASERVWGDGRPLPIWLRRSMYASVPFFLVMAMLNVGLMVASGTVRPGQVGSAVMFVGFAVLAVVTARRGAHPRPPYSTWTADQS